MSATCTTSLPTFIHLSFGTKGNRQELERILDKPEAITDETTPADVIVIWAEDIPRVKDRARQICERGSTLVIVFTFPSQDEIVRTQPETFEDLPRFVAFDLLERPPDDIIKAIKEAAKSKVEAA
ncbi:MAG: hypothetical protein ABIJ72_01275 [bacterium]